MKKLEIYYIGKILLERSLLKTLTPYSKTELWRALNLLIKRQSGVKFAFLLQEVCLVYVLSLKKIK